MKLDITAHDLPDTASDLRIEVRLVDTSEVDAPARNLAATVTIPVRFPEGVQPKTVPLSIPDPELDRRNAPSLLIRLTGQTDAGRKILYLNTSEITVPNRPDATIPVDLFPAN